MYYDGGVGFESISSSDNGPFTILKVNDYIEFYNLRYGAIGRNKKKSPD